jgi:hypothetical protein
MHKFYLGFHVDKFHLKQTNKKELEHFTKDFPFSKNILLWNVQVLFYLFVLNEICLHENRDKIYAFLIKFLVYVVAIHRSI